MWKRILLLLSIIVFVLLQSARAQGVFIWDTITEQNVTLWAHNRLPCPTFIEAETDYQHQLFGHFLPKWSKQKLIQIPIDSIASPAELKGQIRYNLTIGNPNAIHDSKYRYMLPYPQGKTHLLLQGNNSNFTHNLPNSRHAFDFDMPENSLISAARGGTVGLVTIDNKEGGDDENYLTQANKILICHDDGTVALYAHLRHNGALVKMGDQVYAGQVIGFSGNTGYSTTPHLHFVVLAGSNSIPITFYDLPDTLIAGKFYMQQLNFNR